MEEQKVQKLKLSKGSDTFSIVIPAEVEAKIRLLCNNIWNVEWSGVLFYKVDGHFDDKTLTIRCVDIYQMDIGSGTYTEYNMSPDVSSYIIEHPELLEEGVYQGLIHSHNTMNAFFSGTDTKTLEDEGNDMSHFVSLIVNNAGKYVAGITRKGMITQEVKQTFVYPTWGGHQTIHNEVFNIEEESLIWYELAVNIEKTNTFEDEMLARIAEIKETKEKQKKEAAKASQPSGVTKYGKEHNFPKGNRYYQHWGSEDEVFNAQTERGNIAHEEPEFSFQENEVTVSKEVTEDDYNPEIPYGVVTVNPKTVKSIVKQIITSSAIISNESAVDIKKWCQAMTKMYDNRFGSTKEYKEFADSYIDYLLCNTTDKTVMSMVGNDESNMIAILAWDVKQELIKLPKNPYLDVCIEIVEDYII